MKLYRHGPFIANPFSLLWVGLRVFFTLFVIGAIISAVLFLGLLTCSARADYAALNRPTAAPQGR